MIDAVLIFALINVVFEAIIIGFIPPAYRLRLLGHRGAQITVHFVVMCFVLWVHWGTLTGTMSGFLSFILSIFSIELCKLLWGKVYELNDEEIYRRGIIKYREEELAI